MGLASRLYPTSIHLVSIFSPPLDVAVWAFLFYTLGRGLGRSDAKQHKGQAYEFGGACLHVHGDSLTLVTVKHLLNADDLNDDQMKWEKKYLYQYSHSHS